MLNAGVLSPGQLDAPQGVFAAFVIITIVVHVTFAIGVGKDANKRERMKQRVVFAPAIIWSLATLLTGLFGVVIYWLMHNSNLVQEVDRDR